MRILQILQISSMGKKKTIISAAESKLTKNLEHKGNIKISVPRLIVISSN